MANKAIVQNIYGTVHGNVVGGNHTQESAAEPQYRQVTEQELRACIREARALKFKAGLGKILNIPAVGLLCALAFCLSRLPSMLGALTSGAGAQQILSSQLVAIIGLVAVLGFATWLQTVQRRHNITSAYAQERIDQAELALSLRRR